MDPQHFSLKRDFFALVPTNKLKFPENASLSRMNAFFVNDMLLDYHFQKFPPSDQYQIVFWKWAIQHLEELARYNLADEEDEIVSLIYEHFVSLISRNGNFSSGIVPPTPSYITYFWFPNKQDEQQVMNELDCFAATLLESRTTIESGTTGLRTWLASFPLAQYLIQNSHIITSKCVLELGSGIGFLGIVIATLQQLGGGSQPGTLWLSDINDDVLERCRVNMELPCNISSFHPSVNLFKLDWYSSLSTPTTITTLMEDIRPDLVIGADIVFDPSLIPGLVCTIKLCLEKQAKYALIALTIRNEATMSHFLSQIQDSSLSVEALTLPTVLPFSYHNIDLGETETETVILQIKLSQNSMDAKPTNL